ncbi:MAG: adenosine deaminase [Elusimicrobia bacterium]|nr:adenosine deaminase [Elusimicrobiota bacterium]
MKTMMRDILLALPKTDIHCHLDGSVRPATVLELARRLKVKLPADTVEGLLPFVTVAPTCRSLKEFLDVFELIYPLLRDPVSVERIAYELVEDCAKENIRHVEARFAPVLQETSKFSSDQVVEAALKGLRKGFKDFGTTSSVIVCLIRSHGPKENRRAFETLKRMFRPQSRLEEPAVVALDLAGDEARYPTRDYASFYEEAKRLGIWTTCHAGETKGTENLRTALDLCVQRIGHGIHLMEDQKLVAEVVRRKIPVEIGISSNVRTKSVPDLKSHPALDFHKAGVPITLNTDDRGIIGIDLTHEYEEALALGFTLEELAKLAVDSTDHLFLPADQRARLRRRFESEARAALQKENA